MQTPSLIFRQCFDQESGTYTYLIACPETLAAALVDPVIEQHDRDYQLIKELGLKLKYTLETHIHADHVTGLDKIRKATGALGVIPEAPSITCADLQVKDNDILKVGNLTIRVISTPGHTNSHVAYLLDDRVFTGDALLIRGCGRTDFQEGNAGLLYESITKKLFSLPPETKVYPAHDYKGMTVSTILEEKTLNPRLANKTKAEFIEIMNNLNLAPPKKIDEAVPRNCQCGGEV